MNKIKASLFFVVSFSFLLGGALYEGVEARLEHNWVAFGLMIAFAVLAPVIIWLEVLDIMAGFEQKIKSKKRGGEIPTPPHDWNKHQEGD